MPQLDSCGTHGERYNNHILYRSMQRQLTAARILVVLHIVAVSIAAIAIERSNPQVLDSVRSYNARFGIFEPVHPLVRWDVQWYRSIALYGYGSLNFNSIHNIVFLPFYPLAMKFVSMASGTNLLQAGFLVSWAAAIAGFSFVYKYINSVPAFQKQGLATVVTMLAFPLGYIFVTPYSESVYMLCIAATFWFYYQKKTLATNVAAFLAASTRLAGLALVGAFAMAAWQQWRQKTLKLSDIYPIIASAAPLTLYTLYTQYYFDTPFQYLNERRIAFGGQPSAWPWMTIKAGVERFGFFLNDLRIETLDTGFELVALIMALTAAVLLWRRKLYLEFGFIATSCVMILTLGNTWGVGRYVATMVPVFGVLAVALRRRQWSWYGYLSVATLWQLLLLWKYVLFLADAP
jgi:hypothetical protein